MSAWVPTDISRINSGRNRLDVIDVRSNITLGSINKLGWYHNKSQYRVTVVYEISHLPCLWLINIAFTTAKSDEARSLLTSKGSDIDRVFYPTEFQLSHTDTAGLRANTITAYKMLLTKAVYVAIIDAFCGWKLKSDPCIMCFEWINVHTNVYMSQFVYHWHSQVIFYNTTSIYRIQNFQLPHYRPCKKYYSGGAI